MGVLGGLKAFGLRWVQMGSGFRGFAASIFLGSGFGVKDLGIGVAGFSGFRGSAYLKGQGT